MLEQIPAVEVDYPYIAVVVMDTSMELVENHKPPSKILF